MQVPELDLWFENQLLRDEIIRLKAELEVYYERSFNAYLEASAAKRGGAAQPPGGIESDNPLMGLYDEVDHD
jgi:hypothetical protein